MKELGEPRGVGHRFVYFRLKGYNHLGILVPHNFYFKSWWKRFNYIRKEKKIGKLLRKLGISVPRCFKIIRVKAGPDIHHIINNSSMFMKKHISNHFQLGKKYWGLVLEHIEDDVKEVDTKSVEKMFNIEKRKLDGLGIRIGGSDSGPRFNVLFSKKKKKIYLIDFESWEIPHSLWRKKQITQPYL